MNFRIENNKVGEMRRYSRKGILSQQALLAGNLQKISNLENRMVIKDNENSKYSVDTHCENNFQN
jgi:hypothetical protein